MSVEFYFEALYFRGLLFGKGVFQILLNDLFSIIEKVVKAKEQRIGQEI